MSAPARLVRNGSAPRALLAGHTSVWNAFSPPSAHSAFLRRNAKDLPRQLQALAILLPRRGYATETSTSTGGGPHFPPPGFNAEEAKNPLPKDESRESKLASTTKASEEASEQISAAVAEVKEEISKESATGEAKTTAMEKLSLNELATDKAAVTENEEKKVADAKKEPKKLSLMQKIKREALHYWDGTKLLATE
ncbi:hypothetical protein MMC08_001928, partial [Hypocenomyce scalaris]|nr:hypothetical protein [Hypocenomyce scalaris]